MQTLKRLALSTLLLVPVACGGSGEQSTQAPPRSDLPEHFYLAVAPAGALDVAAVHASAKEGDAIVVRGAVGGSEKPFVEGFAAFTIVDPALKSCLGDGMNCPTPWDYCCVDPDSLAQGTATIELHDNGSLLTTSPRGFHGLDHLKTVLVQGTAKRDSQGNLTVLATGLHPLP